MSGGKFIIPFKSTIGFLARKINLSGYFGAKRCEIVVRYSFGPEYHNQFLGLAQVLNREFQDKILVNGYPATERDETFEVYVNDDLIHSKAEGDGFIDSDFKRGKIDEAIREAIGEEYKPPPEC